MFVALSAPMAHADTCAPLDLECLAQQGGDTLGGAVDKGKDAVDGGTGTVGGIVQQAKDTVDGVVNPGGGGSGGGTGGGSGGGSGGASGGDKGGKRHHAGPVGSSPARGFTSTLNTTPATTNDATKATVGAHRRSTVLRSIGGTVVRTAKQLSFPLILAVIVALFVAIQNRVDRNDPKLALAPLTPDRMRFV
jgi:hypothetical protein